MLKTTEIVIEQLLIGIIFLVILIMFLFGNPIKVFYNFSGDLGNFVFTVLIGIVAYACGIIVDRLADTILDDYFHFRRLKVSLKGLSYVDLSNAKDDIFPVNRLRLAILREGSEIADYHDYLRTRIRITRSITCLLPAFFMASLLINCGAVSRDRYFIGFLIATIYTFVLVSQKHKCPELPKTFETGKLMDYLIKRKPVNDNFSDDIKINRKDNYVFLPTAAFLIYIEIMGFVIAYFMIVYHVSPWILGYLPFSVLTTIITGKAWLNISETFFVYLKEFEQESFKTS